MKYRVITGTLEARTAVHVGSGEGNELADSLLRRDTQGNILIPGTAIAGALRAMLTRLAPRLGGGVCIAMLPQKVREKLIQKKKRGCDCAVCRLFGDVDPSDDNERSEEEQKQKPKQVSAASRLLVFNAHLQDDKALPVIRDGVGIDRASGTAARAAAAKFAVETLPAGAKFELRMELREDDPDERMKDEQLLAVALAEWQAGLARLGGDVARGLGAFQLGQVHYHELDLDQNDGLMTFLQENRPWEQVQAQGNWLQDRLGVATQHIGELKNVPGEAVQKFGDFGLDAQEVERLPVSRGWAEWTFTLQAEGPLLTNDATASGLSGFDHAPLLAMMGDWTKPVLTGAGLRGVLRSHAERIARTLVTHRTIVEEKEREARETYFRERCPACDPLARRARRESDGVALECCDSLLRYQLKQDENGEVRPDQLCLACRLFGSTRNGSRLIVEDAPFVGNEPVYKMLDFLAIDRFTGGGAEHFKFDALALWRPAFKVRIFLENPEEWELGWLTLALRDLAEGWLRVGFGAAKGFGQVKITEGTLRLATLDAAKVKEGQPSVYALLDEYSLDEHFFTGESAEAVFWVQAFNNRIQGDEEKQIEPFRRQNGLALPADSYFGVVDDVYGRGAEQ